MNQTTKAFLIQLRDLCRANGVDFAGDSDGAVEFISPDASIEAILYGLEDLEALLSKETAMKYQQVDQLFSMKLSKKREKIYPFNAEVEQFRCPKTDTLRNSISWSHGFTHLKREDGSYAGFCGTGYFEEHAKAIKTKP